MAEKKTAIVPAALAGERIDKALAALIPALSRHLAKKVLGMGGVQVNGKRVRMASFALRAGDKLVAVWHPDVLTPERFPLTVVYEDDELVVVDKPSGQLSQGSELGDVGSLTYELMRRYGPEVRLMHRLDKGASGLLVAAKNPVASAWLTPLFREHRMERRYLALVSRAPHETEITVPIVIEGRKARAGLPGEDGLPARSEVRVLEPRDGAALVEVQLFTGRTHQIRIHLAAVGSPILGDPEYGGPEAPRLALHAAVLGIERPDGRFLRLERPPGEDFWVGHGEFFGAAA
ncbi:MAG TPA: RluA family pseudouridine synthase, partial [Myxococcota bacterium]|nr:RluA family pseudouridine synthase [Myxococcota bacterium]